MQKPTETPDPVERFAVNAKAEKDSSDAEIGGQQRVLRPWESQLVFWACVVFTTFHLYVLNLQPMDPWLFRAAHVTFGSAIGFFVFAAWSGRKSHGIPWYDWIAAAISVAIFVYIKINLDELQFNAGVITSTADFIMAATGVLLLLEITRRCAGLALPLIASLFLLYCFVGPWMPGVLYHRGFAVADTFSFIYSMEGVFGPTTAVSSTYIILFITFSAFLQVSKIGEYFIDFSFALAGRARGGPAKVAVVSSALMGTINGTSAGNVAATGTFTIPLMKRVGYRPQSAAAIEAAASTGGQLMPPVMGAGAFIMAEITGVPYTDIMIAATLPALLYFVSVYFMIDNEARRMNMKGMNSADLPQMRKVLRRSYQFIPLVILIGGLVMGYSVIRAGTLGLISALVTSWLSAETRMGPRQILDGLHQGAKGTLQLLAVCATAGIIVGVIGLTGIGLRFSSMILAVAENSQLLALTFAMMISILLGMGMPTTAAYAVAASVVAPGLIKLGIEPLVAHMFIFYYAVISSITPPVALAAYAGAAIAGSDPMRTSMTAFKYGMAAFIVPFMFFYSSGLLMQGDDMMLIARNGTTALIGVYLLAAGLQGWYFGRADWVARGLVAAAALTLIHGGMLTDGVGVGLAVLAFIYQKMIGVKRATAAP
jgi:TRAP transporter 4TM/12TM fusion protein